MKKVTLVRRDRTQYRGVFKEDSGEREPTPLTHPPIGGVGGRPSRGGVSNAVANGNVASLDADELQRICLGLPKQQRQQLLDHLALSVQIDMNTDSGMWASSVSDALSRRLGAGTDVVYGVQVCKRVLGTPSSFAPVAAFIRESKMDAMTQTERRSSLNYLASLLVDHAIEVSHRTGAPLSVKLVGQCAVNVRSVFDQAFPGYLECGMAGIVFKRRAAGGWDGDRSIAE